MRRLTTALAGLALLAAGCGADSAAHARRRSAARHDSRAGAARRSGAPSTSRAARRRIPAHLLALVSAETEDRLLAVSVPSGRVLQRLRLAPGPRYVAAEPGLAVATSTSAGVVSILAGHPLRVARVLRGFSTPQIAALSPDGRYAYVTDDARGTVTVIDLPRERVMSRVSIGAGAHHVAVSPDGRRMWVALGESAATIVRLDISGAGHPRAVGRLDPGFAAHDLAFSPDGERVWVSSAGGPDVVVLSARTGAPLFRVAVGRGPQHIAFSAGHAYLTSGYGSRIEEVSAATGRVLRRTAAPFGSFELDAAGRYVVTASLLDGRLAIYTRGLHRLRVVRLALATRDVELTRP